MQMEKQESSIIFGKDVVSMINQKKTPNFSPIPANRENNDLLLFFEPQQIINFLVLKL